MEKFSERYLTALFCPRAEGRRSVPENIACIHAPPTIYHTYLDLYHRSLRMACALEQALGDNEHRLAMEEAQLHGHRLPDIDIIHREVKSYREFLESFDPYDVRTAANQYVKLPLGVARNLHNMMHYNCFMLSHVLTACFGTDYLKYFKTLKGYGIPYAGPTALQETYDVIGGLWRTKGENQRTLSNRSKDWPAFLL